MNQYMLHPLVRGPSAAGWKLHHPCRSFFLLVGCCVVMESKFSKTSVKICVGCCTKVRILVEFPRGVSVAQRSFSARVFPWIFFFSVLPEKKHYEAVEHEGISLGEKYP